MDQRFGNNTTKTKSSKWRRLGFSYVLDTDRVDGSTGFALKFQLPTVEFDTFEIRWTLAQSLDFSLARQRSMIELLSKTRLKLSFLIGSQQPQTNDELTQRKKQRHHSCIEEIFGKSSYKGEKSRLIKIERTSKVQQVNLQQERCYCLCGLCVQVVAC